MGMFAGDKSEWSEPSWYEKKEPPMSEGDRKLLDMLERGPARRENAVLDGLRHKVVADFVLCRETPLDRTVRSAEGSGIIQPTMYEITGQSSDKMFIGEVLGAGPGVKVNDQLEAMPVGVGELVILNAQNLSYRIIERGEKRYLVRAGIVAAALNQETFEVKPIQDWILVQASGDEFEKRVMAHQSGGPIWLPSETDTDDVRARHPGRGGMVACYGEVVSKGPGRWRDGNWSSPPCNVGDLLLFDASYGTLPITIKGRAFTLVPSGNVALVADQA